MLRYTQLVTHSGVVTTKAPPPVMSNVAPGAAATRRRQATGRRARNQHELLAVSPMSEAWKLEA